MPKKIKLKNGVGTISSSIGSFNEGKEYIVPDTFINEEIMIIVEDLNEKKSTKSESKKKSSSKKK